MEVKTMLNEEKVSVMELAVNNIRGKLTSHLKDITVDLGNMLINVIGFGEVYMETLSYGDLTDSSGDTWSLSMVVLEDLFSLVRYTLTLKY